MKAELRPFLDIYDFEKRIIENLTFGIKNANDKKIVFVQSYSGKVNSAVAATLLGSLIQIGLSWLEPLVVSMKVLGHSYFERWGFSTTMYGMRTEEGPEVWKIRLNSDLSIAYFGADEKLKISFECKTRF